MSGTSRIPVSLDNLDRFSGENVADLAQDQAAMIILNTWVGQFFQIMPELSLARRASTTVSDRFNAIHIYHRQQGADSFIGFYDYYQSRLDAEEKTAFAQLTEREKDIRLKAAAYALAAGSEPVFAVQTGMRGDQPTIRVMYPKAEPAAEVPQENFSMFVRFMRAVLPRSMYPDFVKTDQERAISVAEEVYDSTKGDVAAAAEALKDKLKVEIIAANALEAHELMVAEAKRRQLMGIDENAEKKDPRANFVVNHEEYAASGTRLDVSLYADSMKNIRIVQEDFPDLQLHDIRFNHEAGMTDRALGGYNPEVGRPEISFNRDKYEKGPYSGSSDFGVGADGRYGLLTASVPFVAAHEAGHVITMGITRMLYGEPIYREAGAPRPTADVYSDLNTEANLAREAMIRTYDSDPDFKAAIDKATLDWSNEHVPSNSSRLTADSNQMEKRSYAIQFMSRTMITATEATPIEQRDDIYADLYKMGYTSKYGASLPIEFTAEAIADHYYVRETNKNLAEGQAPLRVNPLSEQLVKLTKELYNSPDARLSFAEKYNGYATRYNMTVLREVADKERYGAPQQSAQAQQGAQPSVNHVGVEVKLDNKGNETLATDPPPERETRQGDANKGREESESVKEKQNIDMTKGVHRVVKKKF